MVQNKEDLNKTDRIYTSALILISALGLIITGFTVYYYLFGIPLFDKYAIGEYFYIISIIGIVANYNVLFMSVYRVKNSVKELSIYQSIIPLCVFFCTILFSEKYLLFTLIASYVLGNLFSLGVFIKNGKLPYIRQTTFPETKMILTKSILLFIYNVSFYLIIVSIKTLISVYYSVEDFGFFSFAYSLANAILLFLQAVTFLIFPKIIQKLKGEDFIQIQALIENIRNSYVTLSFGMIFCATMFYPALLYFVPKYQTTYNVICFCALATVLYTNSFGYGSFLIAQNKERLIATLAVVSLIVNILIAYVLILIYGVSYEYVILATMIAYMLYTYLCTFHANKILGNRRSFTHNFLITFPVQLLVPFLLNLFINIFNLSFLVWLPFFIFVVLNWKSMRGIVHKFKLLLNNPNVINLK